MADPDSGSGAPGEKRPPFVLRPITRLMLRMLAIFLVVYVVLQVLQFTMVGAVMTMGYAERCPDQGSIVVDSINDTGLLAAPIDDLYPIGSENATSDAYYRPVVGCGLAYAVVTSEVGEAEARETLAAKGWEITENGSGAFHATKFNGDSAVVIGYPEGVPGNAPAALVVTSTVDSPGI